MSEKFLAPDSRGFTPIPQVRIFKGMGTDLLEERPGRMKPAPAAKRRQNTAHGASRGLGHEHEKAPEGRKKFPLAAAPGVFPIVVRFRFHSGTGETMSHRRALLYVPANTGSTLGLHPANFSRRNERATPCI